MKPKVSIILLNWNNEKETIPCLETIYRTDYPNYEVIVVDNGSERGSIQNLRLWGARQLPVETKIVKMSCMLGAVDIVEVRVDESDASINVGSRRNPMSNQLILICNERNDGFARGNNIGMRFALSDRDVRYIVLLNNDTEVEADWLSSLVEVAESDPRVGMCQPKMLTMTDASVIDAIGIGITRFGSARQLALGEKDGGRYKQNQEVFGACAGAALYRREMLEQVGLFDEDFFIYFEDVDLSIRARMAEWKTIYVPKCIVYHMHSATFGRESPFKGYLIARNAYFYGVKVLPGHMLIGFLWGQWWRIFWKVVKCVLSGRARIAGAYLRGSVEGLASLPMILAKRKKTFQSGIYTDRALKKWFGERC